MTKSRHILRRARTAVLLCAALLFAVVYVPGRAWAQEDAATVTARVRMFQEYRVSASGFQSTFDYEIVPLETGAPLPVDESGRSFNKITLTRDEELSVDFPVEVSRSDSADSFVYHYTLKPVKEKLEDGLYYVDILSTSLVAGINVYYLELHVQLSSGDAAAARVTPTVHVETWDGPKVTDPGWRVGYKQPSTSTDSTKPSNTGNGGSSSAGGTSTATNVGSSNPGGTATTTNATTSTNTPARSSLAGTGDVQVSLLVPLCIASAGILLLCAVYRQRVGAGEQDV